MSAHADGGPMGGQAEGLACADPGARTPIGVNGFKKKLARKDILVGQFNLGKTEAAAGG